MNKNTLNSGFRLITRPVAELNSIKGVNFPQYLKFRQLLVTGPPGAGKSTLIRKIGGWLEEGYVDLSLDKWWIAKSLSLRPREIHLGFPCRGFKEALAVFDKQWSCSLTPPELDLARVILPPEKRFFFSVNWHKRFIFEFLIPPPQELFQQRAKRKREYGQHHVDENLTLDQVHNQITIYQMAAWHLHQNGFQVYIREGTDKDPLQIVDTEDD